MIRLAIICLLVAALSACASRFPIAEGLMLKLPDAEVLGADRYATQLVIVRTLVGGNTFQANLELADGILVLVAADAVGTPLFGIQHDRRTRVEPLAPLEGAPPLQLVMADLMLVFAPLQELADNLRGGTVEQDGLIRRIRNRDGREVITITYQASDPWTGRVRLEHAEREYSLEIVTVETGPL